MPRGFDSDDRDAVLIFNENVECPRCGEIFEGIFYDLTSSLSAQDLAEPPRGRHTCPACSTLFETTATGWSFYSEAG